MAGIDTLHVPYQGGGPAVTALLGGQVEALASGPAAAIGQIKGGKMRAQGFRHSAAHHVAEAGLEIGGDAREQRQERCGGFHG